MAGPGRRRRAGHYDAQVPELPEVETVRRQIQPLVSGMAILDGWSHPSAKFASAPDAVGHRISGVSRRGKYLLFGLEPLAPSPGGRRELVVHLGMTGALFVDPGPPDDDYSRAWWNLWFRDVRRFGRTVVVPWGDHRSLPTLRDLGPEPFDPALTGATFHRALATSSRRVKTKLLSQRPIAGIGNIYADEALWRSGIHPGARRLGPERSERLLVHLRAVLGEALDHGGTTLRDYRTPDGGSGRNQHRLDCYGRSGQPCRSCGDLLTSRSIDQRTTTWCPTCQAR